MARSAYVTVQSPPLRHLPFLHLISVPAFISPSASHRHSGLAGPASPHYRMLTPPHSLITNGHTHACAVLRSSPVCESCASSIAPPSLAAAPFRAIVACKRHTTLLAISMYCGLRLYSDPTPLAVQTSSAVGVHPAMRAWPADRRVRARPAPPPITPAITLGGCNQRDVRSLRGEYKYMYRVRSPPTQAHFRRSMPFSSGVEPWVSELSELSTHYQDHRAVD